MRATFFGFEAVRKALMVSQKGLDVTSQNVSNVNTEGYTRQRVDIASLTTDTGVTRFAKAKGDMVGQGADVTGITQTRDQFIDARFRKEYAEYGRWNTKLSIMTDVENVLDEISTNALNQKLNDFYNQLQSFSANSETVEFASIFRSSAQKVVEVFNQYALAIANIKEEQVFNCQTEISDVNNTLVKIAELNKQIKGVYVQGAAPNELLDARNLLMDKLSNLTGATYKFESNGQVSVKLGETYLLDSQKGNHIKKLSLKSNGYPVSVTFEDGSTAAITKGSIAGYLEGLNGKGVFADPSNPLEDNGKGILYFEQSINALAQSFADNFNQINDPSGVKKLFVGVGNGITAGNIDISQDWLSDAMFITRSTVTPSGKDDGRNDNLLKMLASMDEKKSITPFFKGTFEEYVVSIIGDMSVEVDYTTDMQESSAFVLNTIANQRESISGVSIDEEGINMVKFQKSYNAAARIMTAMDEMIETLISRMGVVGR